MKTLKLLSIIGFSSLIITSGLSIKNQKNDNGEMAFNSFNENQIILKENNIPEYLTIEPYIVKQNTNTSWFSIRYQNVGTSEFDAYYSFCKSSSIRSKPIPITKPDSYYYEVDMDFYYDDNTYYRCEDGEPLYIEIWEGASQVNFIARFEFTIPQKKDTTTIEETYYYINNNNLYFSVKPNFGSDYNNGVEISLSNIYDNPYDFKGNVLDQKNVTTDILDENGFYTFGPIPINDNEPLMISTFTKNNSFGQIKRINQEFNSHGEIELAKVLTPTRETEVDISFMWNYNNQKDVELRIWNTDRNMNERVTIPEIESSGLKTITLINLNPDRTQYQHTYINIVKINDDNDISLQSQSESVTFWTSSNGTSHKMSNVVVSNRGFDWIEISFNIIMNDNTLVSMELIQANETLISQDVTSDGTYTMMINDLEVGEDYNWILFSHHRTQSQPIFSSTKSYAKIISTSTKEIGFNDAKINVDVNIGDEIGTRILTLEGDGIHEQIEVSTSRIYTFNLTSLESHTTYNLTTKLEAIDEFPEIIGQTISFTTKKHVEIIETSFEKQLWNYYTLVATINPNDDVGEKIIFEDSINGIKKEGIIDDTNNVQVYVSDLQENTTYDFAITTTSGIVGDNITFDVGEMESFLDDFKVKDVTSNSITVEIDVYHSSSEIPVLVEFICFDILNGSNMSSGEIEIFSSKVISYKFIDLEPESIYILGVKFDGDLINGDEDGDWIYTIKTNNNNTNLSKGAIIGIVIGSIISGIIISGGAFYFKTKNQKKKS